MSPGVILDIVLAIFAVFGLYTVIRLFAALFFRTTGCGVSVEFRTKQDVKEAEYRISCARERLFLPGATHITALLAPAFASDGELLALLAEEGITYYVVHFKNEEGG